ncbi:MAG: GAP family protein [Leifsonia sp.]
MLQAIGALLPISLAMALSTVPFLATVVLLLSPKHVKTSLPYFISYVVGVFLVVAVLSAGLSALPRDVVRGTGFAVVEIIVGVAIIGIGVLQWVRHRDLEPASTNGWLSRVSDFGTWPAVGFALIMNVRPKALLLATAAGLAISSEHLDSSEWLGCVILYTVIASSTVTVPVIITWLRPEMMAHRLVRMRSWILRESGVITVVVLLLVGAGVLGAGIADL